jgi:signal peptidase I
MHSASRTAGGIFGAAVTIVITLLFTCTALALFLFHMSVHPVLTGSMRPTFGPGWAIITKPIPVSDVRPGDIVLFKPPGDAAQYAHRVVTVSGSPAHPVITTKGDANPVPDAWHARLNGATVPEVVAEVPAVGYVMVDIRDQWTHAVLVALLGIALCIVGTRAILGGSGAEPAHRRSRAYAHTASYRTSN